jgi:hypothetical protein
MSGTLNAHAQVNPKILGSDRADVEPRPDGPTDSNLAIVLALIFVVAATVGICRPCGTIQLPPSFGCRQQTFSPRRPYRASLMLSAKATTANVLISTANETLAIVGVVNVAMTPTPITGNALPAKQQMR